MRKGSLPPHYIGAQDQIDPKVIRDMDHKARQILIDTMDPDIIGASQMEIKDKVGAAIKKIMDPTPPEDTSVLEITKLRKGGFTILFKSKDIIKWLQDPGAKFQFISELSQDTSIVKHSYSILIPHIPLSFNPSNNNHLREVEECNSILSNTI